MFQKHKRLMIVFASIIWIACIGCGIYVKDDYPANEYALQALVSDDAVTVKELSDGSYVFVPNEPIAGFIFYPGGKVEHAAYAPLMRGLAERGIQCVLIKMPFNLAVFHVNAAAGVQEQYPSIEEWYIGGHSLGGSMAASYVAEHKEAYEGLCLLASYSTADLSDSGLELLSIYGTQDNVLNMAKYEQYRANLPRNTIEQVIEGGCHAYFGSYGEQDGDGIAVLTAEEQQSVTIEAIIEIIGGYK